MSDVRSLEEVIAAAWEEHDSVEHIAAAVREWCLAPQQIERATRRVAFLIEAEDDEDSEILSRAALHAVIGDTP